MAKTISVTSVEHAPDRDRRLRFIQYTIAMVIRLICIFLAVFIDGWVRWVSIAGAVLLPYFAVVLGNAVGSTKAKSKAESVTPLELH